MNETQEPLLIVKGFAKYYWLALFVVFLILPGVYVLDLFVNQQNFVLSDISPWLILVLVSLFVFLLSLRSRHVLYADRIHHKSWLPFLDKVIFWNAVSRVGYYRRFRSSGGLGMSEFVVSIESEGGGDSTFTYFPRPASVREAIRKIILENISESKISADFLAAESDKGSLFNTSIHSQRRHILVSLFVLLIIFGSLAVLVNYLL